MESPKQRRDRVRLRNASSNIKDVLTYDTVIEKPMVKAAEEKTKTLREDIKGCSTQLTESLRLMENAYLIMTSGDPNRVNAAKHLSTIGTNLYSAQLGARDVVKHLQDRMNLIDDLVPDLIQERKLVSETESLKTSMSKQLESYKRIIESKNQLLIDQDQVLVHFSQRLQQTEALLQSVQDQTDDSHEELKLQNERVRQLEHEKRELKGKLDQKEKILQHKTTQLNKMVDIEVESHVSRNTPYESKDGQVWKELKRVEEENQMLKMMLRSSQIDRKFQSKKKKKKITMPSIRH